ncbi:hypothetical protein ACQEVY_12680 [Streptomyces sp. CA-288835]|uniref:hypothetical protein n=1 Tax=Streptomyces sp. CA-288835 TaxID=3240069 RepID=UPI003D8D1109
MTAPDAAAGAAGGSRETRERMRQYDRLDEQPGRTWLTRLWCGAAVLGIGASVWAFWLTYDDTRDRAASERQIAEACGGLLPGEDVMDLRGGMVRAEPDGREVDPQYPPGVCRIYRVPEPGKSDGLLTLALRTSSDTTPLHSVGDAIGSEPFDYFGREEKNEDEGDVTRRADRTVGQPLGDGTLGVYGADFVTVRADCAPAASDSVPDLLTVTARADYEEVSDEDLSRLADITHKAVAAAVGELGCDVRLRALPADLDPVSRTLKSATAAHDSCAWYSRYIKNSGRGHLPDRVLEVPTASRSTEEPCLLAVSPGAVRAMRNLTEEGLNTRTARSRIPLGGCGPSRTSARMRARSATTTLAMATSSSKPGRQASTKARRSCGLPPPVRASPPYTP